jgi:hypothetical protein
MKVTDEMSPFARELRRTYNTRGHFTCTPNYSSESSPDKALTDTIGLFQQMKEKFWYESAALFYVT